MEDGLRRLIAVLIVLRASTNFVKPFVAGSRFVVFGKLMGGAVATVVAPLFGIGMLIYAYGLWHKRPWAEPVALLYAIWATLNVALFPLVEGVPARFAPAMYLIFAIPGIAVPWLAAYAMRRP